MSHKVQFKTPENGSLSDSFATTFWVFLRKCLFVWKNENKYAL